MRFPSPRAALVAAVTTTLSLGTVTAVAMAGGQSGSVALPQFAPSAPGASAVTFPVPDTPGPAADLPDPGVTAPPSPVSTAPPEATRAPAPRRTPAAAPNTPDSTPSTRADRPTTTRSPGVTRVPRHGQRDNVRTACELGYLSGPICDET